MDVNWAMEIGSTVTAIMAGVTMVLCTRHLDRVLDKRERVTSTIETMGTARDGRKRTGKRHLRYPRTNDSYCWVVGRARIQPVSSELYNDYNIANCAECRRQYTGGVGVLIDNVPTPPYS